MKPSLVQLDRKYLWHPFTQMRDWMREPPVVITRGKGAYLFDNQGRKYLDANSSIWTNLHGHRHPKLDKAVRLQISQIAHCSALGLANEPASLLAKKLIQRAPSSLHRVFYSDDGSTAIETALKMIFQYWHPVSARQRRKKVRSRFLSLGGAYHGDSVGAMSLGGIQPFHQSFRPLLFPTERVMSPYCYRCPYNRAKPERMDARLHRKCQWECLSTVEKTLDGKTGPTRFAAAILEPLIQGAAGMIAHPGGYLRRFASICRQRNVPLILDEVMTAFGRTGTFFACDREKVRPDLLCLAKGLSGGYLPLAATLVSSKIFNAFLGDYSEMKTFFHGHSYTANPLGCRVGLANMEIFDQEPVLKRIRQLAHHLHTRLQDLWNLNTVGDIRQEGMIAGIELVVDWKTRKPFHWKQKVGVRVCRAMSQEGVLTRPIGNVVVLMPPYCTSLKEIDHLVAVLKRAIQNTLG